MVKKLKLTFALADEGTMSMTLSAPKDGLDAGTVQTAAASIVPVLEGASGAAAESLTGAVYITTTEDVIL